MHYILQLFVMFMAVLGTLCYPRGPPTTGLGVCQRLMPRHGAPSTKGNGGFLITNDLSLNENMTGFDYVAGKNYTVNLTANIKNTNFRGFLVQARAVPGSVDTLIGSFFPDTSQHQQLHGCKDGLGVVTKATVTHKNPERKNFVEQIFTWQAPEGVNGTVNFWYTVVQQTQKFFANQKAAPPMIPDITANQNMSEVPQALTGLPANVSLPLASPGHNRLNFRTPKGCNPSECKIYVGISTNTGDPNFLDVYIDGKAKAWVAVGFSETPNMPSTDVLACNINPNTQMVEALDTWNIANGKNNVVDKVSDVILYNGTAQNGRITCTFVRKINGSNVPTEDLNLNNDYFVIYGLRPANPIAGHLGPHKFGAGNPAISTQKFNPVYDGGSSQSNKFPREQFIRAHGILMIIAWPLIAVTGIFFVTWMRPALPKGEWFQVHRAFMLGSLFIGVLGFFLIFIAQLKRSTPGLIDLGSNNKTRTAHFALGIIVMLLHIANPIIAAFRCKPGGKYRWVFNLLHGKFIGSFVEILALINIAIGLAIFSREFSKFAPALTVFWIYIAYFILFLLMMVALFLIYFRVEEHVKLAPSLVKHLVSSKSSDKQGEEMELSQPLTSTDEDKPKNPSKDAPFRWCAFIVFAVVTVPVMIMLIILIAI